MARGGDPHGHRAQPVRDDVVQFPRESESFAVGGGSCVQFTHPLGLLCLRRGQLNAAARHVGRGTQDQRDERVGHRVEENHRRRRSALLDQPDVLQCLQSGTEAEDGDGDQPHPTGPLGDQAEGHHPHGGLCHGGKEPVLLEKSGRDPGGQVSQTGHRESRHGTGTAQRDGRPQSGSGGGNDGQPVRIEPEPVELAEIDRGRHGNQSGHRQAMRTGCTWYTAVRRCRLTRRPAGHEDSVTLPRSGRCCRCGAALPAPAEA